MKLTPRPMLFLIAVTCATSMYGSRAAAAVPDIPIAVVPGSDQTEPRISNNWIAWRDARTSNRVYGVRAVNRAGGSDFWVSPNPGSAYYAPLGFSGDTILFQGNPGSKGTLFYDNLADANPYQKVYDETTNQLTGDIGNNLVVWEDGASAPYGNLYGSYLGSNTKFPISTTGHVFYYPMTDGRFVVWHEINSSSQFELWTKDLQTGVSKMLQSGTGQYADVDNGIVAYGVSSGVGIYNLLTNQNFVIPAPLVSSVSISGDMVVFNVQPNGPSSNYDVWGARISNPQPFVISDAPNHQFLPVVSGNFAVWQDYRNGDVDIYGAAVPEPGVGALLIGALICSVLIRRSR
jgi:beta propeller repeat protein